MVKLIRGVTNAEMLRRNNLDVSRESLTPDDGSPESQTLLPPTGLVGMRIERGSAVSKQREDKKKHNRFAFNDARAGAKSE
jgi:hypothetical protein